MTARLSSVRDGDKVWESDPVPRWSRSSNRLKAGALESGSTPANCTRSAPAAAPLNPATPPQTTRLTASQRSCTRIRRIRRKCLIFLSNARESSAVYTPDDGKNCLYLLIVLQDSCRIEAVAASPWNSGTNRRLLDSRPPRGDKIVTILRLYVPCVNIAVSTENSIRRRNP